MPFVSAAARIGMLDCFRVLAGGGRCLGRCSARGPPAFTYGAASSFGRFSKKKVDSTFAAFETPPDFGLLADLLKDRELLQAFRKGEPNALERVYFEHATALEVRLRSGLARGGTRMHPLTDPDVRDVLQEVFIRAFSASSRSSYDGIRPFGTWLQTIARNLLIDRARRRGLPQAEAELLEFVADDAAGLEETLLDAELQAATALFVEALDPEQRRFVELRFEQERSQEDVARAMNLTRRRVRTLEKYVRTGLHAFLSERGLEPVLTVRPDPAESTSPPGSTRP